MSRVWDICKAIKAVYGNDRFIALYHDWFDTYFEGESEDYMAFQHYVQIKHKDIYKQSVAYARLMGWIE